MVVILLSMLFNCLDFLLIIIICSIILGKVLVLCIVMYIGIFVVVLWYILLIVVLKCILLEVLVVVFKLVRIGIFVVKLVVRVWLNLVMEVLVSILLIIGNFSFKWLVFKWIWKEFLCSVFKLKMVVVMVINVYKL